MLCIYINFFNDDIYIVLEILFGKDIQYILIVETVDFKRVVKGNDYAKFLELAAGEG